jgi:hypothetical protein
LANPIKNSDLYNDDGSLKKLIADLEAATAAYKKMVDTIKGEAVKLEVSLKNVNNTTEEGRKETVKAAKATDEMQKQVDKYNKAMQQNAIDIEEAKRAVKELNRNNRAQARLNASLEGSYDALSAQYTINKQTLNAMSKEMRAAGGAGEKLEKQTKEIYEEMKRLQEATGKHTLSVGDYAKAVRGLPGPLGRWATELTGIKEGLNGGKVALRAMIKQTGVFKVALAATGIGAVVLLLGALYTNLTRTQKGLDAVNRFTAGLSAVFDVVIDRVATFGGAIVKLLKGDFEGAWTDAKASVSGFGTEVVTEFNKASQIEGVMQGIKEETQKLEVQTARTRAEIKKLNLVAEDTTKSTKERSRAAKLAFGLEQNIQSQREDLIKREIKAIKEKNALGETLFEDAQVLADKEKELFTTQQESIEIQTTLQNKLNTINQDGINKATAAAAADKERQNSVRALAVEIENANAKLGGAATVARLEFDRAIEKIDKLKAKAKGLGADLNFDSLELIEESKLVRALDGILGDTGTLQPKLNELGKIAALNFKSGLEGELNQSLPEDLGQNAIAQAEKMQKDFEKKLFKSNVKEGGIFSALGFKLGVDGDEQKVLSDSLKFASDQLNQFAALRKRVADQNVKNAADEVSSAESALQAEIASRNAGFAHNAETAAKELETAKANQRKALKDQEKAQKQQLALQTIQQASNLITAVSKIYATVGFPFSLIASGLMIGSFVASKVKAFQVARKKTFGKGGLETIGGGTHASGNDTYLGFESEGKPAFAERDEAHMIINNKQAPKYKSILPLIAKSLNEGTFENHFQSINKAANDIPLFIEYKSDNSKMEGYLAQMAAKKQEQYFRDGSGNLVRIRGNVKTTYRA